MQKWRDGRLRTHLARKPRATGTLFRSRVQPLAASGNISLMSQAERQHILAATRDALLAALPDAWAIYVFGSFARDDEWPNSDLDLAVLLPPARKIGGLLDVMSRVSAAAHRDVDVVDLRKTGDVLRREVLSEGRTLYVSEPDQVLAWEAAAMSRYARHREEIRDILEDFRRTGVGYHA